jgi:hypothetical protein
MNDPAPIDSFDSWVVPYGKYQQFHFKVDLISLSEKLARFKIHSKNGRFMFLEKNLAKKSGEKWKIGMTNVEFGPNDKATSHTMVSVFDMLDKYLEEREKRAEKE